MALRDTLPYPHPNKQITPVVVGDGETIAAWAVIAAINPKVGLLALPSPPLSGPVASDLAAARQGNVVQALIHVANDRRPPTRSLADHRTPIAGLYLSGAGTSPAGGIAGTPANWPPTPPTPSLPTGPNGREPPP